MRFTLFALVAPFCGVMLFAGMSRWGFDRQSCGVLAAACGFWLMAGFPLTAIYWIVRLVRYAWRSPEAPVSTRQAGFIYPDER